MNKVIRGDMGIIENRSQSGYDGSHLTGPSNSSSDCKSIFKWLANFPQTCNYVFML